MIPLSTHSVSVLERYPAATYADPYQDSPWRVVNTGVRAVIGSPGGSAVQRGGEQVQVSYSIQCDPTDISKSSRVRDEATGVIYDVEWIESYPLLNFMTGQLKRTEGLI